MIPKEKAIELYNKFLNPSGDTYLYGMLEHESAKECALITVNEILSLLWSVKTDVEYFNKVKKEIKKL
jgi:hypothetical protein